MDAFCRYGAEDERGRRALCAQRLFRSQTRGKKVEMDDTRRGATPARKAGDNELLG